MDQLYQSTGWGCAWGGIIGGVLGASGDLVMGTSGVLAFLLSMVGSAVGAYLGFYRGRKDVDELIPRTNFPLEIVKIRKQHGAMWALMGAMVGGAVGSIASGGLVTFTWLMFLSASWATMNFMLLSNIIMGAGMGGMVGGVGGAWIAALMSGFIEKKKVVIRLISRKRSEFM